MVDGYKDIMQWFSIHNLINELKIILEKMNWSLYYQTFKGIISKYAIVNTQKI